MKIHLLMPKVSAERLEEQRERILHAAMACFARDGFQKTTMGDIAAEAGVSDGLAYRYFSGKEEIVREAIRHGTASALERALDPDLGGEESMIPMLLAVSFERFEIPDRKTTVGLRMRSVSEGLDDAAAREQVVGRWRDHAELWESHLSADQERGLLAEDIDAAALARVMVAIHDGLDTQWALDSEMDVEACRRAVSAVVGALHSTPHNVS